MERESLPAGTSSATSEEGTSQRPTILGSQKNPTSSITLMVNTLKDAMTEAISQISQENRCTIMELIKNLKPAETSSVRISDVYFPAYDPDDGINVREWVDLISRTQMEYKLKDNEVRLKAASVLKGRAKSWADECILRTTTWEEMKMDMLQTFEPESRYFTDILKFRSYSIDNAASVPEYISNVWKMFKLIVKPNPTEQDAVEFIIGSITDDRIRTELLNSKSQTVPELIAIAKTMRKRHYPQYYRDVPQKRLRLDVDQERREKDKNLACYVCGSVGHRAQFCPKRAVNRDNANAPEEKQQKKDCSFCSMPGHSYETCFKRINKEKNVNICISKSKGESSNTMLVSIGTTSFLCIFDSGADCSLVKESIAMTLPGTRKHSSTYLKGIGAIPIVSLTVIITTCVICGISIELLLYVVQDHEIPTDIIIGRDLLIIPGIEVHMTCKGTTISRRSQELPNLMINYVSAKHLDTDICDKNELLALMNLLEQYENFFIQGIPSTRIKTGKLTIRLKNPDKIVERRPYRLTPIEREKVNNMISELLKKNIIRESNSPFASPIILVKKKNGDDRLCVDYRELNANTVRDHYPLPIITDQLNELAEAKLFTSLDMAAGFHQIPISEESIERTAFITPDGQYEYLTMPFGLSNAPSVYQRAINKALGELRGKAALVYIDDVLVPSKTFEEGLIKLNQVIEALSNAGFAFNIKKCSFMKTSIEYLGFVISDGKVRPSPAKVDALSKSIPPKSVKQLRQFNGLAGYFRRFIPNFSTEMAPLYELTKTGAKWEWTERHEAVRHKIIKYLTSSPLLTIFQEGLPIELHTDASAVGLGAVLIQIKENCKHVIGYFSMRTTKPESNYHSYELETLAIVRAVKHFRHFLYGRKFTIITDCNAVKASRYKQELLPRIHRWWAFLQHYDFEVEYRKGEKLQHADFFSRNPEKSILTLTTNDDWLLMEQRRDPELSLVMADLIRDPQSHQDYELKHNILYRKIENEGKTKLFKVVPQSFQWSLINAYHDSLKHMGWEKTLTKIRENFWFPRMSSVVRYFIEHCVICKTQKGTSGATQSQLHPIEKVPEPFHTLHIDISGKLSGAATQKEYVFVAIDAYTKFVILKYAKSKNQENALRHLKEVVFLFGAPKRIIVDSDGAFTSNYKDYCNEFGIELHQCAGYSSRSNGQVERVMRILNNGLTIIKNTAKGHWEKSLGTLQLAINCTVSKATGKSPIELLTGRRGCVPPELISMIDEETERVDPDSMREAIQKRMAEQAMQNKERFDRGKAKVKRFSKGEYVLVREPPRLGTKLSQKYDGPYEIYKVLPHDRYEVRRISGRGRPRKVCHEHLVAVSAMNKYND